MIKNNFWESLLWIIIWVSILLFVILWVANLLISSKDILDTYNNKKAISILKNNTEIIIKKIDTSNIKETEIFYLHKDNSTNRYEVFTWAVNYTYKYIDENWNNVNDLINFKWYIYSRELWVERNDDSFWNESQIIKASIKQVIRK